ncbi:DUF4156 domain-containing protein [Shewanella olleyana]|uniref:DUF4156 domain-containing protein n=1 Tax=Shewanella olleyana TaxID=135626 RepID=UPI00200F9098|nr:DUF4156 domain-containing protein [Shewanella olleyana]MCL1066744.1 DUF4156 domain-containing protein [Shewanella olleyana]
MMKSTQSIYPKLAVAFAKLTSLSACITLPDAKTEEVAVLWSEQGDMDVCQLKGTLIGSQGHWYDYIFISNKDLTQGAVNQLRNEAKQLGANTVFLYKPKAFATSVTLLANAYVCP